VVRSVKLCGKAHQDKPTTGREGKILSEEISYRKTTVISHLHWIQHWNRACPSKHARALEKGYIFISLFAWLGLGLPAGFIASHLVNHRGEGMVLDVLLGIVGAVVGGLAHLAGGASLTRLDLFSVLGDMPP
jgi:uncharacterized membrane protein YeaQ/YmgE (transglycosylase-associated protein family)